MKFWMQVKQKISVRGIRSNFVFKLNLPNQSKATKYWANFQQKQQGSSFSCFGTIHA